MERIYLDNNATTELAPEVLQAVCQALTIFGNPSSMHSFGQQARALLLQARDEVARFFQVSPQELVFTSSGTEALNMLLRGFFAGQKRGHIITSSIEHSAVFNTVGALVDLGCRATYLNPGLCGTVKKEQVVDAIQEETRLIVLSAANSETGVKCDIESIAKVAERRGIACVVDGVGLLGKELFQIPNGVSAIAFSGHKVHAPKGVGLAIMRKQFACTPYLTGGLQESGRRAGTEDVAAICGFQVALQILQEALPAAERQMRDLRDYFENELMLLGDVLINGQAERVCNTSNVAFLGVEGEVLLRQLDLNGIAASHGSACASGALEPSRVLLNMGLGKERAAASLRFSLSRYTTRQEVDRALSIIKAAVKKFR